MASEALALLEALKVEPEEEENFRSMQTKLLVENEGLVLEQPRPRKLRRLNAHSDFSHCM